MAWVGTRVLSEFFALKFSVFPVRWIHSIERDADGTIRSRTVYPRTEVAAVRRRAASPNIHSSGGNNNVKWNRLRSRLSTSRQWRA